MDNLAFNFIDYQWILPPDNFAINYFIDKFVGGNGLSNSR